MYVVFVEDDPLQIDDLNSDIKNAFSNPEGEIIKVVNIHTEQEFVSQLDYIVRGKPDVFIIDMLLRWTNPSPNMERPPEEVANGGFFRAGLRCVKRLLENEKTKNTPIIIYTVLEESDLAPDLKRLPSNVSYLRKDISTEPLIRKIRNIMHS